MPVARRLAEILLASAGFAIQYSLLVKFEGLANNLHKPVGEAVEAFAEKDLWRVLNTTIFAIGVAALFLNDSPKTVASLN